MNSETTMKSETVAIHYAHCVKWTVGKKDVEPYSKYETRQVDAEVAKLLPDMVFGSEEYEVSINGKKLSVEDSLPNALAVAAYVLMSESRRNEAIKAMYQLQQQ